MGNLWWISPIHSLLAPQGLQGDGRGALPTGLTAPHSSAPRTKTKDGSPVLYSRRVSEPPNAFSSVYRITSSQASEGVE